MGKLFRKKPNKPEEKLRRVLHKLFPGEFTFVGDRQFFIGEKNPDFVHIKKPLVIEMFGDYWHKREEVEERTKYFKGYGYKTHIVWESELLENEKEVEKELSNFMRKEGFEMVKRYVRKNNGSKAKKPKPKRRLAHPELNLPPGSVGSFEYKNNVVVGQLSKYKSHDYFGIRVYYFEKTDARDGEEVKNLLPGKNGINIQVEDFPAFKKLVLELEEELIRLNFLDPEALPPV